MKKIFFFCLVACISLTGFSRTILVKNIEEFKKANAQAVPGDIIVLKNGIWNDVTLALTCNGTKERPVTLKAETAGKVIISGNSKLKLGGNFLVADGLYFKNGYAGKDPVINFRVDNKQLANNCRVTNCVIDDFNNPKRMDENNWILFYGKNNRLDHCSFLNKKNMGVLLAVILDDDRSRENFHAIDHNYFGIRIPLASNGGEIIRVGVSQHCQFNSNTQIIDNYFEHCDGETEIVSIKSGSNVVRNNLFKECQGGVVLRHGDYNIVEDNVFLGNGKEGTGGVRIINKGQRVTGNLFYKCRGVDFRSPMSIMNGIPNSPAHRYVQVTDAVITRNTFFECSPISFCEGSDTERTLPPQKVEFAQNAFINTKDTAIYKVYDDISGISFADNTVSNSITQQLHPGFTKENINHLKLIRPDKNSIANRGAKWFKASLKSIKSETVRCFNAIEVYKQLNRNKPLIIQLTGKFYTVDKPFVITNNITFSGPLSLYTKDIPAVFLIAGKGNLTLNNLHVEAKDVNARNFISNDTSGSSEHYNVTVRNSSFKNIKTGSFFYAYKNMVADSITIADNLFTDNQMNGVIMNEEKDNKGYYNAEKIKINNNSFKNQHGVLMDIYRGGNDESTMGPNLSFKNNKLENCSSDSALIHLFGVQRSSIQKNEFINTNTGTVLLRYEDRVRADHRFTANNLKNSGEVIENKFVSRK